MWIGTVSLYCGNLKPGTWLLQIVHHSLHISSTTVNLGGTAAMAYKTRLNLRHMHRKTWLPQPEQISVIERNKNVEVEPIPRTTTQTRSLGIVDDDLPRRALREMFESDSYQVAQGPPLSCQRHIAANPLCQGQSATPNSWRMRVPNRVAMFVLSLLFQAQIPGIFLRSVSSIRLGSTIWH